MGSQNVETFRAAHQAFNRRDFDAVVSTMTDDFTYEDHARGVTFRGRDGFKEWLQGWVGGMSDAEVTQPIYIDGGDTVIAQFMGRGTQDGPLGPLPAAGGKLNLPMCEFFRFDDRGQMVAGGIYYDQLSMLGQLGHAPAGAA